LEERVFLLFGSGNAQGTAFVEERVFLLFASENAQGTVFLEERVVLLFGSKLGISESSWSKLA
jgi:hypothetical protein